jgi:phosphatidylglycerol:prolipoprotein diacylglycerol transferase
VAAVVSLQIFSRELVRAGLPARVTDVGFAGVFGGLIGAKLWWTVEFFRTEPFAALLFSRGGMSWFGGLSGGLLAGLALIRIRMLPIIPILAAASPALAIGHAIGRIGCFLVGDDYGRPSDLPWAVAFPEGLPPTLIRVHPTQLYESIALVVIGVGLLHLRRRAYNDRVVFGVYLVSVGMTRFLIEFVRVNARVIGPLTIAQLAAASAVMVGAWLLSTVATPDVPSGQSV